MRTVESSIEGAIFARFSENDDLLENIASVAKSADLDSGFFLLIGTLKRAVLGFFKEGKYWPIEVTGPLEIASCIGNISTKGSDELAVHGHIVVSDSDGRAFGGHLLPGCHVDVTAELVLMKTETGTLKREFEPEKNLHLWNLKR